MTRGVPTVLEDPNADKVHRQNHEAQRYHVEQKQFGDKRSFTSGVHRKIDDLLAVGKPRDQQGHQLGQRERIAHQEQEPAAQTRIERIEAVDRQSHRDESHVAGDR